jgi:uncharacterized protein with PIN domain
MAIVCSNCGRQYDVTLFQFGRTIDCACGTKVGHEHRLNLPENTEVRFFADVNVGRLTRWLRALGIDTAWEDRISDGDLVRRALTENRNILTLDKRLPIEWRIGNVLLLKTQVPFEQLREVVEHFKIPRRGKLFTRCLMCNEPLREALNEEIARHVPETMRTWEDKIFQYCPNCRKVYWEGSHTVRMKKAIEDLFDSPKQ